MDDARKKLRACLILVVAAAVIVGCIYYFSGADTGQEVSEGTLISIELESRG